MGGKPTDYAGMIAVYDQISRSRPLTAEEEERLLYLVKREKAVVRERRYRERHKERLAAEKKAYYQTPAGRAAIKRANDRAYIRHHADKLRRAKEWREKNPDKWQVHVEKKRAKREEAKRRRNECKSDAKIATSPVD